MKKTPKAQVVYHDMGAYLDIAIQWAAGLNGSYSDNWPTTPSEETMAWLKLMPWQVWQGPGESTILVINKHGEPQVFQRVWDTRKYYPQTKQTLVASIFKIDDTITVVLADGFEHLLNVLHNVE